MVPQELVWVLRFSILIDCVPPAGAAACTAKEKALSLLSSIFRIPGRGRPSARALRRGRKLRIDNSLGPRVVENVQSINAVTHDEDGSRFDMDSFSLL